MRKAYCDKCGAENAEYTATIGGDTFFILKRDLCRKCEEELIKWLNKKIETEE